MTSGHWNVLLVYFVFTVIATLLALARRWLKPGAAGASVWRKYPAYIFINLVFLAACWSPAEWHALAVLLAVLGLLASWEIARWLLRSPQTIIFPFVTFAFIVSAAFLDGTDWFENWFAVFLLAVAASALIGRPADYPARALMLAGCLIYLPFCLAAYLWIQQADPSGFRAAFLYLVIATNDALAQITGELFGRRQLTPQISPSKTVEGALGGLLFACAMGIALSGATGLTMITGAILGLILGLAGLVGDLTASVWKRALGIINFSALLGAQGGVLDRFDSLIFAAPVFYVLLQVGSKMSP